MSTNGFDTFDVTSAYGGGNGGYGYDDGGKTEILGNQNYGGGADDFGATKIIGDTDRTEKENGFDWGKPEKDDPGDRTVIDLPPSVKLDPAVGWLVCIEGVDKGRSFRLVKGNNTIGRPGNDKKYAVPLTDQGISRKGAVGVIVYNEKSNRFFITPGELTNNINPYLNDEILLSPQKLEPRARIEIAGDILLFVPFCCDKFVWKFREEEKEQQQQQPKPTTGTIVQCPKGHYYNTAFHKECPTCKQMDNDPDGMTRVYF